MLERVWRRRARARRKRVVGGMGLAVAGVTLLDALTGGWRSGRRARRWARVFGRRSVLVRKTITVNRSPDDAYDYWRDLEQLPRFLAPLESVRVIDPIRSRWVGWGPAGTRMEWEAELVEDRPGERLSWRSTGGVFEHTTRIKFLPRPGNRGTEVLVEVAFHAPGGPLGT